MITRSLILCSLLTFGIVGCGTSGNSSTSTDELQQYIDENPDANVTTDGQVDNGDTAG